RRIYAIDDGVPTDPILLQYVNRLSDYFFVLAKKINILEGVEENFWKNR
ncbi:MAG: ATP:cob(I)alamin adenosyltransferase, partial [Bacteroidaceae bacterium]|nr:ATP:cob(I)alamin adenosyltransferase [Bacteroidaceae bacterium]